MLNTTVELNNIIKVTNAYFPESHTGIRVNYQMASTLVTTEYSYLSFSLRIDIPPFFLLKENVDVVWPGDLASNLLDLTPYFTAADNAIHNPMISNCDMVAGKQVAVPFYADFGIMYYRKDLLQKYGFTAPPNTWDEMETMAKTITAGEKNVVGYVAQFNGYEGLTCNVMEWIRSADGGSIVNIDGKVDFNNPNVDAIMRRVQNWFKAGIVPKYALT
ncbi:hypothetical protein HK101_005137 [Irineochytrium annulatum]|nr:hypothetical protein HK101_005137 [Irineochytrium annulatum]